MPVFLMFEWDNAKDESRYKKYGNVTRGMMANPNSMVQKLVKEGVLRAHAVADNTGHIINWFEFENMEALGKLWNDEEFQRGRMKINPLVDNLRIRLLRPSVSIPEE